MDPPPPLTAPPAAANPAAPTVHHQPVALNHPPFAEMISAAITALNERDGSSKEAIAKYIETHYSDHLPPTHSTLLTHHLHRLTATGHLLMLNHSYTLPSLRSTAPPPAPKRGRGRPPKPKPDAVPVPTVPVFPPPPININDSPPENAVNGTAPAVRGLGRPPKSAKRGPGRPPKGGGGGVPKAKVAGRPRGRPPKPINVVEGFTLPVSGGAAAQPDNSAPTVDAPVVVTGKRRGRPPKAGSEAKKARYIKARNLSGKPLGRPRKNAEAMVNRAPDSQLLMAYLDLKTKLENLQSMVKQAATFIRPSLTSEAAINAIQELERLALNASAPPNAQIQQQPLPQQVQPAVI